MWLAWGAVVNPQARDAGKTVEDYLRGLRQEARRLAREEERRLIEEEQAAIARGETPPPRPPKPPKPKPKVRPPIGGSTGRRRSSLGMGKLAARRGSAISHASSIRSGACGLCDGCSARC